MKKTNKLTPTLGCYSINTVNRKRYIKRYARYAPQLLADGLTSGIVSDQANLVHGAFDDGDDIDPFCNIESDKFTIMNAGFSSPNPDPSSITPPDSNV